MLFNSYLFVLCFLPVTLIGYFLINRASDTIANVFLLGMSLWFYGYFNPVYLWILGGSIVVNYLFSVLIRGDKASLSKWMTVLAVLFNIGLLFYFKYFDFFIENINRAFGTSFALRNILLPLGISFFTFQQISYIVDTYRGEASDYGFLEYAVFVSFFPQLIAGPIVLHGELIPQLRDKAKRIWNWENFSEGMMIFAIGLFKKVEIADTFGRVVDFGFSNTSTLTSLDILLVMLSYTFQIYFDFSAYSDMAVGIGKMFNFELPMNFNSPYKSATVTEFWKRWHITLTRFLRTYIYFPLGGSRKGQGRTYRNILIVFLISGLWHGANWTFVLWGLLHGIVNVVERMTMKAEPVKWRRTVHYGLTFLFLNVTWLLFRADSVSQWWKMLGRMLAFRGRGITISLDDTFFTVANHLANVLHHSISGTQIFGAVFPFFLLACFLICLKGKNVFAMKFQTNWKSLFITGILLLISILSFSRESAFIYFNF